MKTPIAPSSPMTAVLSLILFATVYGTDDKNHHVMREQAEMRTLDHQLLSQPSSLRGGRSITAVEHVDQLLKADTTISEIKQRQLESSSDLPSYEEILNIFGRKNGGNNKKKKTKKNRNKNKDNDDSSDDDSSDDDSSDNSSDDDSSDDDSSAEDGKNVSEYKGKNSALGFMWHLWYTKGIKYEQRGTDFCVMCPGKDGCEKGSPVVTTHCNPNDPDQRWDYIKVKDNAGQLKTRHHNLCLEMRDKDKMYRLQKCDEDEERQWFQGLRYNGKFKLHPYKRQNKNNKQCMSMLHHPLAKKEHDGEEIIDQPCHKPERTQTVYWTADFRDEVEEEIGFKDYDCSSKGNRCEECKGDCSDDDDCEKGLKCFQRNEKGWRTGVEEGWHPNAWAKIPGCKGMGKYGRDYCYDPKKA